MKSILVKLIVLIVFFQILIQKVFGKSSFQFIGYLDELILVGIMISVILNYRYYIKSKNFKIFLLYYLFLIFIGIYPILLSGKGFAPAILQIFLNTKFFLYTIFLSFGHNSEKLWRWLLKLFKGIILVNLGLIFLQFTNEPLYFSLFDSSGADGRIVVNGNMVERAVGVFWHSSQLATFCCLVLFAFWRLRQNIFWNFLIIVELLLSFQRQEIATVLICFIVCFYLFNKNNRAFTLKIAKILLPIVAIIISYLFVKFFSDSFSRYIDSYSLLETDDTRLIFYLNSINIAISYFPFGSGLGTFGGHAAYLFDSVLYGQLGFDNYWWYREGRYMTDTYYPQVIAETGFIGFIVFCIVVIKFYKYLVSRSEFFSVKIAYLYVFMFVFITGFTSPIINDQLAIVLGAILPSCLMRREI